MGRKGEMAVVESIVRRIIMDMTTSSAPTRKWLLERIYKEHGIGERSFDKALSFINRAGILIKKNSPITFRDDFKANGKPRKGTRTVYLIDFEKALRLYAAMQTTEFGKDITDMPSNAKDFLLKRYYVLNATVVQEELKIVNDMLKEFPRTDPAHLSPGEKYAFNLLSSRVMNYLEAQKQQEKAISETHQNGNAEVVMAQEE